MTHSEWQQLKRDYANGVYKHEAFIVELNKHFTGNEIGYRLNEAHQLRLKVQYKRPKPARKAVRRGRLVGGEIVWD